MWFSFTANSYLNYYADFSNTSSPVLHIDKDGEYELLVDGKVVLISGEEISSFFETYTRNYTNQESLRIANSVDDFLADIAQGVNSLPINARMTFQNGVLKTLQQEVPGKKLNISNSVENIFKSLKKGENQIYLVIDEIEADLTVEKFQQLKISSLLAKGESDFSGSSAARIHNIKVGAAKYNGYLIPPGEEFSFNEILGNVDAAAGYLPELVIKSNKVIPEYGGGICQVSTTLFRAVLHAGLPITERRNHSFPVKYYNPQGWDATIYPGVVDLKFTNDTGEYILVQTKINGTNITFELYGNDDGRIVEVERPKQFPKEDGGLYTTFNRTIQKGEEIVTNTFNSNYKSKDKFPLEKNPLE